MGHGFPEKDVKYSTVLENFGTNSHLRDDDDDDDDVDWEEAVGRAELNLPGDARDQRCSSDAVESDRARRAPPRPSVHRQDLPPVIRPSQPEEEVPHQSSQ